MKKIQILVLILTVMFLVPASGLSNEFVEQSANGSINWSSGTIEAVGIGVPPQRFYGKPQARPMALRAAKLDAQRNLLEIAKGVRIDARTTVKDFAVDSDIIMSRVDGMVKGAEVVKKEYMSDGTVEITMRMSMKGGFAETILPQDIRPLDNIIPMEPAYPPPTSYPPASYPPPPPPPVTSNPLPPSMPSSGVYTGMVVDASGLGAKPAMSPKILDENGQEVYGSAYVSREFAVQQGMSGYAKNLASAQGNQRVTNNPVTVKGIKTKGPGRSDIVISNADAARLKSASDNLSFMKKCRVMIVLD